MSSLHFSTKRDDIEIKMNENLGMWLVKTLSTISITPSKTTTFDFFKNDFMRHNLGDFTVFWNSFTIAQLRDNGLIIV